MRSIEAKIEQALVTYRMVPRNGTLVAGVSGGPDSMAMLYLLASLRRKHGFGMVAAHFNHKLRRGSAGDCLLVQKACEALGVTFEKGAAHHDLRKCGDSLEQACRFARQGFFASVVKKHKASAVCLAHTLDDQAETVLMRLIRGAGLYGIAAITPKRRINGIDYTRPLLTVSKSEVLAYLSRRRIRFSVDETNKQDVFLRNRVRNVLLPLIARYNPQIKEALCNLAESAGFDYELLVDIASKKMPKQMRRCGLALRCAQLAKCAPSLRRMMLRLAIERVQGDLRRITFTHIRDAEDLLFNRPVASVMHLPEGLRIVKTKDSLVFSK